MSPYTIRKATESDLPAIKGFLDKVFFPDNPGLYPRLFPQLYNDPRTATRESHVAVDGDRVIGHVGVYPFRLHIGGGVELSAAGVGGVATDPEYRGRGVMTALLQVAIATMEAACYDISILWGDRKRYLPFGWETVGRRVEWRFDQRIAMAAGAKPISLIAFDPKRHLDAFVESWNSDACGTLHDSQSLAALMGRRWRTAIVAEASPCAPMAFVTYQIRDGAIIVDKIVGPEDHLPGILLGLIDFEKEKPPKMLVRCPGAPHPVARMGMDLNSELTVRPACHARVINPHRLATKLQIKSPLPADSCKAVRVLFGTPADATSPPYSLLIEETADV